MPLTAQRLRELVTYDPETGIFRWRLSNTRRKAGDAAGGISPRGYVRLGVDRKVYFAHRLAWLYVYGTWPSMALDHVNADKLDNRITNLREASASENQWNRPRNVGKDNPKGVHFSTRRNRWSARIKMDGAEKHLGRFDTKEEAAAAYERAARAAFGEFARTED